MSISFTGITIYKTNLKHPYSTFSNEIKRKHLEQSVMVAPHTKDDKSVLVLDGEDCTNYFKRMAVLNEIYPTWASPAYRERKALEKKATVVDLRDLKPLEKFRVLYTEEDVLRVNDEMVRKANERL